MAMVVVALLLRTKAFERGVHLRGLVRVMVLGASPPCAWDAGALVRIACIACIYNESACEHMWASECGALRSLPPTLSPTLRLPVHVSVVRYVVRLYLLPRDLRVVDIHTFMHAIPAPPTPPVPPFFSKLKILHRFFFNRCQSSSGSMSSKSSLFSQALGCGMTLSCISGSSSSLSRWESGGGS